MPKSTRCGTCCTPIKGHARRDTGKATRVTTKMRKQTPRQSEVAHMRAVEAFSDHYRITQKSNDLRPGSEAYFQQLRHERG